MTIHPIFAVCGILIFALAPSATAGSLTPPGPPAPTMKTLDEVEARIPIHASDIPLNINRSGSYYFTENITFTTTGTNGIIISAPDVVIDLNGFILKGPGRDSSNSGDGIRYNHITTGTITIKNGIVRDWGNDGMDLIGAPNAIVSNMVSAFNNIYGVSMGTGLISDSTFHDNGIAGAIMFNGTIKDCSFKDNNFGAVTGQFADSGGVITNNQFFGHSPYSIRVNGGNFHIRNNSITGSGSATGIFVGAGKSLVTGNVVTNHSTPYNLDASCTAGPIIQLNGGTISTGHAWANFRD